MCFQSPDEFILDVSGPGAVAPPLGMLNIMDSLHPPTNRTIIHVNDLIDLYSTAPLEFLHTSLATMPTSNPLTDKIIPTLPRASPGLTPAPLRLLETADIRPDRPIVIYFVADAAKSGVRVLQMMPSLAVLHENEVCDITGGDRKRRFGIVEGKGASSLYFAHRRTSRGIHRIEVTCRPLREDAAVKLEPFVFRLELHIN